MENSLQIFNFENKQVRTQQLNSEVYFCLRDVCDILEIKNVGNAKSRLFEKGVCTMDTLTRGGIQKLNYINESNLYKLIFQSRNPNAEKFTDWVTTDVLPSIRKHGAYLTNNTLEKALFNPDFLIQLATKLKEEKEINEELRLQNNIKEQQILELQPKATYYDLVLQCKDLLSVTQIAKDYGKSAKWLNETLSKFKVQYKVSGQWFLYQKYAKQGYKSSKTTQYIGRDNKPRTKLLTCWTQKGRLFIYDLLKKKGILPNMEKNEIF